MKVKQHTKRDKKDARQSSSKSVRNGKPSVTVSKQTTPGGFVILSKEEVAANRCKAYSYIA